MNLNDIAIAVGTNTVVVKRWMHIIKDIQRRNPLIYLSKKGLRYQFDKGVPNSNSLTLFVDPRSKLGFDDWYDDQVSHYNDLWEPTLNRESADLIFIEPNGLNISESKDLLVSPALCLEHSKFPINSNDAFFFVYGWEHGKRSFSSSHLSMSQESLGLLSTNLNLIFSTREGEKIHELVPLFFPSIGVPVLSEMRSLEQYVSSIPILYALDEEAGIDLKKVDLFNNLTPDKINLLSSTYEGRLLLSKMAYCLKDPNLFGSEEKELNEIYLWQTGSLLETSDSELFHKRIERCFQYLISLEETEFSISLIKFFSIILNYDYDPEFDTTYEALKSKSRNKWYTALYLIAGALNRLRTTWNWEDAGFLLGLRSKLLDSNFRFLNLLILQKIREYSHVGGLNWLLSGQLSTITRKLSSKILYETSMLDLIRLNWHFGDSFETIRLIDEILVYLQDSNKPHVIFDLIILQLILGRCQAVIRQVEAMLKKSFNLSPLPQTNIINTFLSEFSNLKLLPGGMQQQDPHHPTFIFASEFLKKAHSLVQSGLEHSLLQLHQEKIEEYGFYDLNLIELFEPEGGSKVELDNIGDALNFSDQLAFLLMSRQGLFFGDRYYKKFLENIYTNHFDELLSYSPEILVQFLGCIQHSNSKFGSNRTIRELEKNLRGILGPNDSIISIYDENAFSHLYQHILEDSELKKSKQFPSGIFREMNEISVISPLKLLRIMSFRFVFQHRYEVE